MGATPGRQEDPSVSGCSPPRHGSHTHDQEGLQDGRSILSLTVNPQSSEEARPFSRASQKRCPTQEHGAPQADGDPSLQGWGSCHHGSGLLLSAASGGFGLSFQGPKTSVHSPQPFTHTLHCSVETRGLNTEPRLRAGPAASFNSRPQLGN